MDPDEKVPVVERRDAHVAPTRTVSTLLLHVDDTVICIKTHADLQRVSDAAAAWARLVKKVQRCVLAGGPLILLRCNVTLVSSDCS